MKFLDKSYQVKSNKYLYYKMKFYRIPMECKVSRKRVIKYLIKQLCQIK